METIFMNSGNSKIPDPQRLLDNFSDNINLKQNINMLLCQTITNYKKKNIKKSYKNNKFEISEPLQNGHFQITHRSYSVSDFQHYFKYVIKNNETVTGTLPIRVHANGHFYAVLLERTKNSNTPKNENGVNVLVHCNIVSNDCDQYSKVVYRRFVSNNLPFRISTY